MDPYHVLGVSPTASDGEIKAVWRALILLHHPDKQSSSESNGSNVVGSSRQTREERLHAITQAYDLLRDPIKREAYDRELRDAARLSGQRGGGRGIPQAPPPLARTTVSLELFEPQFNDVRQRSSASSSSASAPTLPGGGRGGGDDQGKGEDEVDEDPEPSSYTYPCRCGREFEITQEDLEAGVDVVGCDGCGDYIGVGYEVVEDEEGEGED